MTTYEEGLIVEASDRMVGGDRRASIEYAHLLPLRKAIIQGHLERLSVNTHVKKRSRCSNCWSIGTGKSLN